MKKWIFPSAKNIGLKGFNDIGEEFKDNPIPSLAKEICQNSLDTLFIERYQGPIKVTFNEFFINPCDIPGYNDLLKVFKEEYNFNSKRYKNDKTVPNFYKYALEQLKKEKMKCLRISDFNTTGLLGSDKESESPWCDLTKNAGVSDKPAGSSGSKGKGKFASFICSYLYTVFFSTLDKDGLKASCGVSRLSSYQLSDGSITIGECYYENEDRLYKNDTVLNLDPNFNRNSIGTDIYIVGFRDEYSDWQYQVVASIIDNFFAAIIKNELIISINDNLELNKDTLLDLINDEQIKRYLNLDTKNYIDILLGYNEERENIIVENYSMFKNNDLTLILKADDKKNTNSYNNSVVVVRSTGMKILDLGRLPKLGLYHGVLLMNGIEINDYFRKLENASHNKWSSERALERGENPMEAKAKISELKKFVNNSIKNNFTNKVVNKIDATGVSDFLPDEDDSFDNDNENIKESIENIAIKTISKKEIKPVYNEDYLIESDDNKEIVLSDNGEEIDVIDDIDNSFGETNKFSNNKNPFSENAKLFSEVNKTVISNKIRILPMNEYYRIIFSLKTDEDLVKISLNISGENYKEKVNIKDAKIKKANKLLSKMASCDVEGNSILLKNINKFEEYFVDVRIDDEEKWTLGVDFYGKAE